jgi:hypothetical protein
MFTSLLLTSEIALQITFSIGVQVAERPLSLFYGRGEPNAPLDFFEFGLGIPEKPKKVTIKSNGFRGQQIRFRVITLLEGTLNVKNRPRVGGSRARGRG